MSISFVEKFEIFSQIDTTIRQSVKIFHVFNAGKSALFVTNDDLVYGLGDNTGRYFKLGHSNHIPTPTLISELCHKRVKQFINSLGVVFTITADHHVFRFGDKWIQTIHEVSYLNDKNIAQICCGYQHSLALTTDGQVYAWGDDLCYRIDFDRYVDEKYKPIKSEFVNKHVIKSIYCNLRCSFVVTTEGRVFIWKNSNKCFPSDLKEIKKTLNSKVLATISNIKSIAFYDYQTYFLTNSGQIYIATQLRGFMYGDNTFKYGDPIQLEYSCQELQQYYSHNDFENLSLLMNDKIYKLTLGNKFVETEYGNFNDYFAEMYEITYNTQLNVNSPLPSQIRRFFISFDKLKEIGQGGFGVVYQARYKRDNHIYAIKKIDTSDFSDKEIDRLSTEVNILNAVESQYVVQNYGSWAESKYFYIQLEYYESDNIDKFVELKRQVFGRQSGEPMDCVEYLISCEIFHQILESVQYLHSKHIIHRDINPGNILIAKNIMNDRFVKLCDFGLATVHDKRVHYRTTRKHTTDVGHSSYVPLEVMRGEKYGPKADVHNVGLIGSEIFEFDLSDCDPNKHYFSNGVLNERAYCLHTTLVSMVISPNWRSRPECSEVLAKYNEWSIDKDIVIKDPKFVSIKERLKSNKNTIFYDICDYILNDPDTSVINDQPGCSGEGGSKTKRIKIS